MTKNIYLFLLAILVFVSCKNETIPENFASISGTISNSKDNVATISNRKYSKSITIDPSGKFSDTLHIEDGFYVLKNGSDNVILELKNGYNLDVSYDTDKLVETLTFSGLGAVSNNYFAERIRLQESDGFQDYNSYFMLDKPAFDAKVNQVQRTLENLLSTAQGLDSTIVKNERRSNQQLLAYLRGNYTQKHEILTRLAIGMKSPTFTYPDINGKNVSLKSLKGKYVYIDVWATWCGPCKVQIPYLKDIEKTYEGRNIAFIGLSIDTQENKSKWEAMVGERGLGGHQLLADKDWKSEFIMEYYITGIPRFILIDPQGNIVSADAPRPSDPALIKLFDELKI